MQADYPDNPLLHPSDKPYGVPDFPNITTEHIKDALRVGMNEEKELWRTVGSNPARPTIQNTVIPLDLGSPVLNRATSVFYTLLSAIGGEELESLYEEMSPQFAAHYDDFIMDAAIYGRYQAVLDDETQDPETKWLLTQTVAEFERNGVHLSPSGQRALRRYNAEIAKISAQIDATISRQLQRTGTGGDALEDLEGLTDSQTKDAITAGKPRGLTWWLAASNYTQPPLIGRLKRRDVRTRALRDSITRGDGADPDLDTRSQVIELAYARAQRAALLGFESHAESVMEEETVPSPREAIAMLRSVADAAKRKLSHEEEDYSSKWKEKLGDLGPADWLLVEEELRSELLGVDANVLGQYLPLKQVLQDGVFFAANKLYGLGFKPRPDILGWVDEVQTWQVTDADGRTIGLFMTDYYARPGKSGGAWMSEVQPASALAGTIPIITNNANFQRPEPGEDTLLSWEEVETLFHEFGHALHGLFSSTFYTATAGTDVPRDFVELPSQLNEMWAYHPKVLGNFARHHRTGEKLPQRVVDRIRQTKNFGQAFSALEYVQAALIDQAWHGSSFPLPEGPELIEQFERDLLGEWGAQHAVVRPRYRTPYFAHVFAGGYDGAYYSYMWAEAMVGELEKWFTEDAPEGFNREKGQLLVRELLSRGNSRPPLESFVAVAHKLPSADAVIWRRGLNEA